MCHFCGLTAVASLLLQGGGAALLNAHDLAWAPVLVGLVLPAGAAASFSQLHM
jgi:hypothetical protein